MASLAGSLMVSVVRSAMQKRGREAGQTADDDAEQRAAESVDDRRDVEKAEVSMAEIGESGEHAGASYGRRTRKSRWKISVIAPPAPRPTTTANNTSRTPSARPSARRSGSLQAQDRDADEERCGEPERQAVADQGDAEREAENQHERRCDARLRRRRARPGIDRRRARRAANCATRAARQAAASRRRASAGNKPGTVYGWMSWLCSRSIRSDAIRTAAPSTPQPSACLQLGACREAHLVRRQLGVGVVLHVRSAQGLAMPTLSGETLALPLSNSIQAFACTAG